MRMNRTTVGLACMMAVLMLAVLGGCGEQAQEMSGDLPDIMDEGGAPVGAAAPDGGEAAEIPDSAETLADVIGSFTMPTSFRMTVEHDGETQTMAMAMSGDQATKMRVEHDTPQGTEVFIMNFDGGEMISYNATEKSGFRFPIGEAEAGDAPQPWEDYDAAARVVGSEEIDGVDCWIVEIGEEAGTAWIGKRDGLMRKVEDGESVTTFTISDLNAVPDSVFEVPGDVEIGEMPMGAG
ncbi:MAG: hypothetical protein ACOX9R_10455 [Armatimonadota bacterium]|jgi:hypothetical protein